MPKVATYTGSGTFVYNWNTKSVPNGRYEIKVTAHDGSGGTTDATRIITVNNGAVIDDVKPNVAIQIPLAGATVSGNVQIEATASDNVAIAQVEIYVDGVLKRSFNALPSGLYAHSWNSKTVLNGNHTIAVVARDESGNTQTASRVVVVNNLITTDLVNPVTGITSPLPNATVSGIVSVAFTATDNVGLQRVEVYVDDVLLRAYSSFPGDSFIYEWNSSNYENGVHALRITARDTSNNTASTTINVTSDNDDVQPLPPVPGDGASNWAIVVKDADTGLVKSIHAWANAYVNFSDLGSREAQLGRNKSGIRMIFNNVASPTYYNCVEATWTGNIPMSDLDLVTIYTRGYQGGESKDVYYPRFVGRAEIPGSPDQIVKVTDDTQYRIVGLLEDAKGSTENKEYAVNTAISSVANTLISTYKPAAVNISYIPSIAGATLDKIYNPNYNDLITILESLKAKLEAKGIKVAYGINGNGIFYFIKVSESLVEFEVNEQEKLTDKVEWPERITQDYFNQVRWLIADGNIPSIFHPKDSLEPTLLTPDTLSYISDSGEGFFDKVKPVDVPNDVVALKAILGRWVGDDWSDDTAYYQLNQGVLTKSFATNDIQDSSVNMRRVFDGYPYSYIQVEQESTIFADIHKATITLIFQSPGFPDSIFKRGDIAALKLRIKGSNESLPLKPGGWVRIELTTSASVKPIVLYQAQDFPDIDEYFIVGDRGRAISGDELFSTITISVITANIEDISQTPLIFNIEDLRVFVIDKAELDLQAKKEYSLPKSTQFRAGKKGQHPLRPRVRVIRSDGDDKGIVYPDAYEVFITPSDATRTWAIFGDGALYGFAGAASKKAANRDKKARTDAVASVMKGLR